MGYPNSRYVWDIQIHDVYGISKFTTCMHPKMHHGNSSLFPVDWYWRKCDSTIFEVFGIRILEELGHFGRPKPTPKIQNPFPFRFRGCSNPKNGPNPKNPKSLPLPLPWLLQPRISKIPSASASVNAPISRIQNPFRFRFRGWPALLVTKCNLGRNAWGRFCAK